MIDVVLRAEARAAVASGLVQEVRERSRLSKREFAQALGVTGTAVDLWEKRHQMPRGETAERLGALLRELAGDPGASGAVNGERPPVRKGPRAGNNLERDGRGRFA